MDNFSFLLKSYLEDIEYVDRLLKSFKIYNKSNIRLFLVVPQKDLMHFAKFEDKSIILLKEELLDKYLVKENVNGVRPGYINQEIIKLSFWELGFCKNYLCLDSDGVFLRNFYYHDFMYNDEIPYTILVEDNELKIEPEYYKKHWISRDIQLKKIIKSIGLQKTSHYLTCHGFAIFSYKVLNSLKENFMRSNNYSYLNLLEISPYEFSWYNFWIQYDKTIEIHIREPLFKYLHHKNQHLDLILKNITIDDISRGYLGLVVNSNYSRFMGVVNYDEDKYKIIANYFEVGVIFNALLYKFKNKMKIKL